MSTIPPRELLHRWQLEKISVEMAIGHILQNLVNTQKSLDVINTEYFTLRADVDALARHSNLILEKKKPTKRE